MLVVAVEVVVLRDVIDGETGAGSSLKASRRGRRGVVL